MILRLLPFLFLACLAAALWSSGLIEYVSLTGLMQARDALQAHVAEHLFRSAGAYFLTYVAFAALAFPISPLLGLAAGFLFGPWLATLVCVAGATCGGALLFLATRFGFASFLSARLGPRLQAFARGFREDSAAYMLFLRVAIVFPSWFVNIATGLIGIRLTTFLWTTALGILPVTLAFTLVGAGLEKALATPADISPLALLQPEFTIGLSVLAVTSLVSILWRQRWRTNL